MFRVWGTDLATLPLDLRASSDVGVEGPGLYHKVGTWMRKAWALEVVSIPLERRAAPCTPGSNPKARLGHSSVGDVQLRRHLPRPA